MHTKCNQTPITASTKYYTKQTFHTIFITQNSNKLRIICSIHSKSKREWMENCRWRFIMQTENSDFINIFENKRRSLFSLLVLIEKDFSFQHFEQNIHFVCTESNNWINRKKKMKRILPCWKINCWIKWKIHPQTNYIWLLYSWEDEKSANSRNVCHSNPFKLQQIEFKWIKWQQKKRENVIPISRN